MISASDAPLAPFIIAITSAFLLAQSVFGYLDGFLARPVFFAGLDLLEGVRFVFGCGTSGADTFPSPQLHTSKYKSSADR